MREKKPSVSFHGIKIQLFAQRQLEYFACLFMTVSLHNVPCTDAVHIHKILIGKYVVEGIMAADDVTPPSECIHTCM
jgi:hypothetical protein